MNLKGLLNDYEVVKLGIEDAQKRMEILRERVESAKKRLAELGGGEAVRQKTQLGDGTFYITHESAINVALRKKEQATIAFAAGEISEAELAAVKESCEAMQKEKMEIQEFLRAAEAAHQKIHETIMKLSPKLSTCRHEFWEAVVAELKGKIPGDVVSKIHAVYAAALLSGGVSSYEGFLRQIFPMPSFDENQKRQAELMEKYHFV